MLTLEKIKVYQQFGGDLEGWARMHGGADASGMTDGDWYLIEELRQGLALVASGLASDSFAAAVEKRLHASTAGEPTRQALRGLVTGPGMLQG